MGVPDLTPRSVAPVHTKYRRIATSIPVPESIPILEKLARLEPRFMLGQPPIVWDRAEGISVFDRWGNQWIDWTSGVLVANAGHAHPHIRQAVARQVEHPLMHNFMFPTEIRAQAAEALLGVAPEPLEKVYWLTTGSEAVECAVKLTRNHGRAIGGDRKIGIVTFQNAFHGRTLGSLQAGGTPGLKEWIVNLDKDFVQVPFPDGFRGGPDMSFDGFLRALDELGMTPDRVAGVMSETYQGGNSSFMPPEYAQRLRRWCDQHEALLIFDEVQAGFGRTGRFWAFEHYGVVPDLVTCGKGISSGLPASAVIGRFDVMDRLPPGSMTVTHSGNPLSMAAVVANLEVIRDENLVDNARRMGEILQPEVRRLQKRFPKHVGCVHGEGLVASLHIVHPGGTEANADLADDIIMRCVGKGLMLFAAVGYGGASVKVCPPLVINEEALREGISVLEESLQEACDE